jgi:hypothetical protein
MAPMSKYEKLGKWLDKASTAASKDQKLNVKIMTVDDLKDVEFIKTGIEPFDTMVGGFPRAMQLMMIII